MSTPTLSADTFTPSERRAAWSLAGIFSLRMLGLFIMLPVFSLYAQQLAGATPLLIGLAMGVYGLMQGVLQIPFGLLSDRYARKHVIAVGLLLFAGGSLIAAGSTSIGGLFLGRALQGAGAVGSATIALVADLTRETQRTKAMAIVGISIGLSFYLGMLLGPLLTQWLSVPALFGFTALLAGVALVVLTYGVPTPPPQPRPTEPPAHTLKKILQQPALLRLNAGIFILHLLLTALFVVLPMALHARWGLNAHQQGWIYLPVLLVACVLAGPFIFYADKKRITKPLFIASIVLLLVAQLSLCLFPLTLALVFVSLIGFFTAFTFLEATLPSLISQAAPPASKGAAMGVYSSAQFLGIFMGGMVGGWLYHHGSLERVFAVGALLALLWLVLAIKMPSSHTHSLSEQPSF